MESLIHSIFGTRKEARKMASFEVPVNFLLTGPNVLAVEVHQSSVAVSGAEFDLSFDLLMSTVPFPPAPRLSITTNGNTAIVRWPDFVDSTWQLEQTGDFSGWTAVAGSPTLANGFYQLSVPIGAPRFFRLHQASPP